MDGNGNTCLLLVRLDPPNASPKPYAEGIAQVCMVDFEGELDDLPGKKGLVRFEEYAHGAEVAGYAPAPFQTYWKFTLVPRRLPLLHGIQQNLRIPHSARKLEVSLIG